MKNYFSSNFKLGILGGGQLGKMLLLETQRLDIQTHIMDKNEDAPSRSLCQKFVKGDLNNFDDVYSFGKTVDTLTIEIEHVNIDALKKLEQEGVKVFPSAKSLEIIKNKSKQKDFYKDKNIPTSKYFKVSNIQELKKIIENKELSFPFVWKSCEMGYDGKGVKIIKNKEELAFLENINEQIILIEQCIDIEKELGVIVAKNENGEMAVYPVIEMEFNDEVNLVEYVICPCSLSKEIEEKSKIIAKKVVKELDTCGIFAVELFLTKNKEILVNETAPRVHNSGHFTLNGSYTSQFEQHIRAILNLPLGNTECILNSVMLNLVGEDNYTGRVYYEGIRNILKEKGIYPFIYGKKGTKPFRKMGHINIVSENSIEEVKKRAIEIKKMIRVISQ